MDSTLLFLSLFFSTVGFGYFIYGKKRPAYPFMFSGAVLMIYGYFIENVWVSLGIGVALLVAPFLIG